MSCLAVAVASEHLGEDPSLRTVERTRHSGAIQITCGGRGYLQLTRFQLAAFLTTHSRTIYPEIALLMTGCKVHSHHRLTTPCRQSTQPPSSRHARQTWQPSECSFDFVRQTQVAQTK